MTEKNRVIPEGRRPIRDLTGYLTTEIPVRKPGGNELFQQSVRIPAPTAQYDVLQPCHCEKQLAAARRSSNHIDPPVKPEGVGM
jgi:hypothetical protein